MRLHSSRPRLVLSLHVFGMGTVLTCIILCGHFWSCSGSSHSPASNLQRLPPRVVTSLQNLRGGSSPIELNPGYSGETVGDLEAKYRHPASNSNAALSHIMVAAPNLFPGP